MLRFCLVVATFLATALSSDVPQKDGKIMLDVYYESLCQDSREFLINQLGRHYDAISTFVDVRLIPFGKASFESKNNGGYAFQCQHGPRECQGNMLHACGIEYSNSTAQATNYAICLMRSIANSEKCVETFNLDYETIKKCAFTTIEGQKLLQQHGVETLALKPRMTFVPWLIFNQKWSVENQDGGLEDLKGTACKMAPANTAACQ